MPYDAPDLSKLSLGEIAELAAARQLPPVKDWKPQNSSDSLMQITSDGRWFHDGGEITRAAMVRAFSSLLRRDDDGSFWLVTPHEKQSIIVDDAPFVAVELRSDGEGKDRRLAFRLNTDDLVMADADHPIELRGDGENALPYLHLRDGLWAKLARPVYYELAELALSENPDNPGLWSESTFFPVGSAA